MSQESIYASTFPLYVTENCSTLQDKNSSNCNVSSFAVALTRSGKKSANIARLLMAKCAMQHQHPVVALWRAKGVQK